MLKWGRAHALEIGVVVGLLCLWELVSHVAPKSSISTSPLVPPFEVIFGPHLKDMSSYWTIDAIAPSPVNGGESTWLGAILAIGYHSMLTWMRLLAGLLLGGLVGTLAGLLMSSSRTLRAAMSAPLHILRMLPLLAMVPLFQFWVGATTWGVIIFVAYGAGVVYFVGTVNAVANVPQRYIEFSRTLGASRLTSYRRVVVPAILPELASSIVLTLGLSWSAVLAAEYIGIPTGLGHVLQYAERFAFTGRMALIAILVVVYAAISYAVFGRIAKRLLTWTPDAVSQPSRGVMATVDTTTK